MMLVYRVETEYGSGPYVDTNFSAVDEMSSAHMDSEHPTPQSYRSGLDGIDVDEYCGFDTLSALVNWFDGFTYDLGEDGFDVSVYSAPSARVGTYGQALFVKHESTLIQRIKITDVVDLVRSAAFYRDEMEMV